MKTTRIIGGVTAALLVLAVSSGARALDGYQDRTGFFFGLGGQGDMAIASGEMGFGGGGGFMLGGGATQDFTIEVDVNCLYLTPGSGALTLLGGPRAAYFVWQGLYLRVGVDFGWIHNSDIDVMTVAPKAGVGYEFFFDANWAGSLGLDYEHLFLINDPDFDLVALSLEFRYY